MKEIRFWGIGFLFVVSILSKKLLLLAASAALLTGSQGLLSTRCTLPIPIQKHQIIDLKPYIQTPK